MKFHALLGLSLVCLLGCGVAEEEDGDLDIDFMQQALKSQKMMERMCKDQAKATAFFQCIRKFLSPEELQAQSKCLVQVFGSQLSDAELIKTLCDPSEKDKVKKFQECQKATNQKGVTDEKKKNAKACFKQ